MPRPTNPDLRDDLLDAATALLDARGDVDFSMRDLCAEVGYSVTAAYRAFGSRAQLLQALQLKLFAALGEALMSPPAADLAVEIQALGSRFIGWAIAHPGRYHFMFHATAPEALLQPADQALARAPLRYLEQLLARGHSCGALRVEDPAAAAVMLFATLHGLVSLHLAARLDPVTVPDLQAFHERWSATWLVALAATTTERDK